MTFKLISIHVPSKDMGAAVKFYQAMSGLEPARSLTNQVDISAHHVPLTLDGIWLWLTVPQHEQDNSIAAFFAVDDLSSAAELAVANGATAITQPTLLPIPGDTMADYQQDLTDLGVTEPLTDNLGKFQLFNDPNGAVIGLIQIEPHSHVFYNIGRFATGQATNSLNDSQVTLHKRSIENGQKHAQRLGII